MWVKRQFRLASAAVHTLCSFSAGVPVLALPNLPIPPSFYITHQHDRTTIRTHTHRLVCNVHSVFCFFFFALLNTEKRMKLVESIQIGNDMPFIFWYGKIELDLSDDIN